MSNSSSGNSGSSGNSSSIISNVDETITKINIPNLPFNLVKIGVPGDGNCYFHSLLRAFLIVYIKGDEDRRLEIVKAVRKELSVKLNDVDAKGVKIYDKLCNGNLKAFSTCVYECTLDNMIKRLDSSDAIEADIYQEFVSDALKIDIYIIDSITGKLYKSPDSLLTYKNRDSVILMYSRPPLGFHIGHFELIGIDNGKDVCGSGDLTGGMRSVDLNNILTFFKYDSAFIKSLKSMNSN